MRYETPEHIIITIIQSAISGGAVYWIVSPYIHKYEKGRNFLRFFILLEFFHRLFRTFCYYRVSKVIWTTEYLLYYILMLAVFAIFLSGNLAKHLVYIFAAAFLFDLFGTVSMIGMLFLNAHYQSRSYERVRIDYEELEEQRKNYDNKTEEFYVIKQEALKHLDEGCRTGGSEYEREIVEHFETALKDEKIFKEKAEQKL